MPILRPLISKNIIILYRNPMKSFIQLFLPVITIVLLYPLFKYFNTNSDYNKKTIPPNDIDFYFNHAKLSKMKHRIESVSNFGVISKNNTLIDKFIQFISSNEYGVCIESECIIDIFNNEEMFYKSDNISTYKYAIELLYNNDNEDIGFNLYIDDEFIHEELSDYISKKSLLNIIPFMFKNKNITIDYNDDITVTKYNIISFYQNYLSLFILYLNNKELNNNLVISLFPIAFNHTRIQSIQNFIPLTLMHNVLFVFISISFIGIILQFSLWIINEKEIKINELLLRQGISKTSYILSWLFSYIFITLFPFAIVIVSLNYFYFNNKCLNILIITIGEYAFSLFWFYFCICEITSSMHITQGVIITLHICLNIIVFSLKNNISWLMLLFPQGFLISNLRLIYLGSLFENGINFTNTIYYTYNNESMYWNILMNICGYFIYVILFIIYKYWTKIDILFLKRLLYRIFIRKKHNVNKFHSNSSPTLNDSFLMSSEDFTGKFIHKNFEDVDINKHYGGSDRKNVLYINNISKKYGDFYAVKNFTCKINPGKIFVLLGANGAGKSTLLKLISNYELPETSLPNSKSDILFNNRSLLNDIDYLYNNIGYCPQDNIYFNDLSIEEHLQMIIQFKKLHHSPFDEKEKIIYHLGLKNIREELARNLPEGNLRRLSLALGLIGNANLILLDEPTSGMDFHSKKRIWKYLKQIKHNKIIILTTHSFEEAEYLADTIGIMVEGELVCCGSPSYLKMKYPCGYNVTFIMDGNKSSLRSKAELIRELKEIVNSEVTIKLLGKDFMKLNFSEENIKLNELSGSKLEKLFQRIKALKNKFYILDYTVSTSSLEDVFLKVNNNEFTKCLYEKEMEQLIGEVIIKKENNENEDTISEKLSDVSFDSQLSNFNDDSSFCDFDNINTSNNNNNNNNEININYNYEYKKNAPFLIKSTDIFLDDIVNVQEYRTNAELTRHLKRHYLTLYRNKSQFILQLLTSAFVILFYLMIINYNNLSYQHNMNMNHIHLDMLIDDDQIFYYQVDNYNKKYNYTPQTFMNVEHNNKVKYIEKNYPFFQLDMFFYEDYANFLYKNSTEHNEKISLLIINGASTVTFNIFYALHGSTLRYVAVNNILTSYLKYHYNITTSLLNNIIPLSYTAIDNNNNSLLTNTLFVQSLCSLCLIISYLIFISYFIIIPLYERITEIKHINYLNGNNTFIYWLSLFIFDYTKLILFTIFLYISISILNNTIPNPSIMLLLFSIPSIILSYIFSFEFNEERHAITFHFIFNFIISLLMTFPEYFHKQMRKHLFMHNISLSDLNPYSSLYKYYMILWQIQNEAYDLTRSNLYRHIICVCAVQTIIYVIIVFALENNIMYTIYLYIQYYKSNKNDKISLEQFYLPSKHKDISIFHEIDKVKSNPKTKFTLLIHNLQVKYKMLCKRSKLAIDKLHLGLENYEKFALMGYNGAGKTTIIKSLINEIVYDKGQIKIFDKDIKSSFNKLRLKIGYCSQLNCLFNYLTVQETFEHYFKKHKKEFISELLKRYGLYTYKNTYTINLSSGNKRKLIFAIALMNNPDLLLLDEFSTGVDSDSKRLMWKNIWNINMFKRNINTNFNMIISTHSFEEAEILCDKLGWLKKGNFTCIGNSEELKLKYAKGYYLTLKFNKPLSISALYEMGYNNEYNVMFYNINVFSNLKIEHIYDFCKGINDIERKATLLYYFHKMDEIVGMIKEYVNEIEFVRRNDMYFVLLIKVKKEYQEYLFSNLLGLKYYDKDIAELSIMIEPLDNFIGKL